MPYLGEGCGLAGQSCLASLPLGSAGGSSYVGRDGMFTKQEATAQEISWLAQGLACQGEAEVKLSHPEGSEEWHSLRQVTGVLLSLEQVW